MTAGAGKSRLSIGFYDCGEHLCSTVVRLVDLGISRDQLGIVTRRGTLSRLTVPASPGFKNNVISRLFQEIESLPTSELPDVVASLGQIHTMLGRTVPEFGADVVNPLSIVSPEFGEHLRNGATALAVTSKSSEQQWASARVLLERSVFPVVTHEFRLPDKR